LNRSFTGDLIGAVHSAAIPSCLRRVEAALLYLEHIQDGQGADGGHEVRDRQVCGEESHGGAVGGAWPLRAVADGHGDVVHRAGIGGSKVHVGYNDKLVWHHTLSGGAQRGGSTEEERMERKKKKTMTEPV
jgi:hypothetical protein